MSDSSIDKDLASSIDLFYYGWKGVNLKVNSLTLFNKRVALNYILTVAWTPSSWRAPWLDTAIPATPWWIASSASSGRKIPFTTIGRVVILQFVFIHLLYKLCILLKENYDLSQSMSFHVKLGSSIESKIAAKLDPSLAAKFASLNKSCKVGMNSSFSQNLNIKNHTMTAKLLEMRR